MTYGDADESSFINDEDSDQDDRSSRDEANTALSPPASPAASPSSQPASEPALALSGPAASSAALEPDDEAASASFIASDEDLPSVVLPGDPSFDERHGITRRFSQRRSRRRKQPSNQKHAAAICKAAHRAVHDDQTCRERLTGSSQPKSQPAYTLAQLGLITCQSCKNISYEKASCGCGASELAQQVPQQVPHSCAHADPAAADGDESLPFSVLARADRDHGASAGPLPAPTPAEQLPPSAAIAASPGEQAAPTDLQQLPHIAQLPSSAAMHGSPDQQAAAQQDEEDDFAAPVQQHRRVGAARRASLVLDEDREDDKEADLLPGTGNGVASVASASRIKPGSAARRTLVIHDDESDAEHDSQGKRRPTMPSSAPEDKHPAPAARAPGRQGSPSRTEDLPASGQHGRDGGAPSTSLIEDASLDNDTEFPLGIAPDPSSRKRKRLRHAQQEDSDDTSHQTDKEPRVSSSGKHLARQRPQHSQEAELFSIVGGERGRRIRSARQHGSQSTPQLQDRIKQHQQSLLDGGGDALRSPTSSEDDGEDEDEASPETSAEGLGLEDDLDSFIDDDEDAEPDVGDEDDDAEGEDDEKPQKASSSRRSPKRLFPRRVTSTSSTSLQ